MQSIKLNPIASNMTELETANNVILFSYKTPVACRDSGGNYYRTKQFWSKTTSRHINKWMDGVQAREMPQEFFESLV
jgi:hypothetical protein